LAYEALELDFESLEEQAMQMSAFYKSISVFPPPPFEKWIIPMTAAPCRAAI
jgi:hypothetical protein